MVGVCGLPKGGQQRRGGTSRRSQVEEGGCFGRAGKRPRGRAAGGLGVVWVCPAVQAPGVGIVLHARYRTGCWRVVLGAGCWVFGACSRRDKRQASSRQARRGGGGGSGNAMPSRSSSVLGAVLVLCCTVLCYALLGAWSWVAGSLCHRCNECQSSQCTNRH